MKNLSIASVIEKNKLASGQAWLIALKVDVKNPVTGAIDGHIYMVRNDEPVTIDGQVYEPMPFEVTIDESVDGLPTISVTLQDQTQIVHSYMQAYAGGVGFPVTIMAVTGDDTTAMVSEPDLVEFFEILNGSSDRASYTAAWELGVENPLTIAFPRRRQYTDQCSFRFKSPECGYTGAAETCDLTLGGTNGCRAKDNVVNFGGFPGLIARG